MANSSQRALLWALTTYFVILPQILHVATALPGRNINEPHGYDEYDSRSQQPHNHHDEPSYSKNTHEEYTKPDDHAYGGGKASIQTICLQRFASEEIEPENVIESFKCCSEYEKDVHSCGVERHPYTHEKKDLWRITDFSPVKDNKTALICSRNHLPDAVCPEFVASSRCFVHEMNCTFNVHAKECGCPDHLTSFTTKLYIVNGDVYTCPPTVIPERRKAASESAGAGQRLVTAAVEGSDSDYYNSEESTGLVVADALLAQGKIKAFGGRDYYYAHKVKGNVRYTPLLATFGNATEPVYGHEDHRPVVREGQMLISLLEYKEAYEN